jgi:hypothetical protein
MTYYWWLAILVGVALQLLLIAALLRGWYREFKILSLYVVVLFLTTVIDAAAFYNAASQVRSARYYWTADAVRQALIFLVVLSFTHKALAQRANKRAVRRLLWGGACLYVLTSLYFTMDPRIGHWMTNLSRNLGFLAVILNLVLWAVLIQFGRADRVLLMISGGMGIQMAGKAIGHSLRQFAGRLEVTGNIVVVLTHLLCLYVWWQAFRRVDPSKRAIVE